MHIDYGLCHLGADQRLALTDTTVHTIALRFRNGDAVRVPIADAVRIWGYGAHLSRAELGEADGRAWGVEQAARVVELRESLDVIRARRAARLARTGYAIHIDGPALADAGRGFPHDLTSDQARCIREIADDLAREVPTNRLLVGDVGCGKTEVAVRLALAAARHGQVRLLAPTRVLARQHHRDLVDRARGLGLRAALYSGDLTKTAKAKLVPGLDGIDILVGTHGALGLPGDPVLMILDEEQKFGNKLKRAGFDPDAMGNFLRLTATPIPRTIAEARIGVVDVSEIHSYPGGRGRTTTEVAPLTEDVLRDRVEVELARNGQVILMCARIRDLKALRHHVARLFPGASLDRVHGRRRARQNRAALTRLRDGQTDILLATSMLETGMNLPNANLMLVFGADRFGVAQLHQLRGRIGRGSRDARFVMMVPDGQSSDGFAARREMLEALAERGDGLRLALADSLARGSGSFTDDDQSGHASALGIELYAHLLDVVADGEVNPLHSVPAISGDADWALCDLDHAIAESRAGLRGLGDKRYARAIAACTRAGAVAAKLADGELVLTLPDGSECEAAFPAP